MSVIDDMRKTIDGLDGNEAALKAIDELSSLYDLVREQIEVEINNVEKWTDEEYLYYGKHEVLKILILNCHRGLKTKEMDFKAIDDRFAEFEDWQNIKRECGYED